MKRFELAVALLLVGVLPCAQAAAAATEASQNQIAVKKVAAAFATSHILGSGAEQYLTSVSVLSDTGAVAIIGQNDADTDDPNAYRANLKKSKGQWRIISYEFIFIPTEKRIVEKISPPFPSPYWTKIIKENQ